MVRENPLYAQETAPPSIEYVTEGGRGGGAKLMPKILRREKYLLLPGFEPQLVQPVA